MSKKKIYKINLSSPENATCDEHEIQYVVWTQELVDTAKRVLQQHKNIVWQRDYSSDSHNCRRYNDFNRLFSVDFNLQHVFCRDCPQSNTFLRKNTKTINERFRQALLAHDESCCKICDNIHCDVYEKLLRLLEP